MPTGRELYDCEQMDFGCFYVSDVRANFSMAVEGCAEKGLHLASPKSLEDLSQLRTYLMTSLNFWGRCC